MKRILFCASAACACAVVQAFTLVGPGARARVVVASDLPGFVWRAAQDLTNDVKKITGADVPLVRGGPARSGDVSVAVRPDGRWEAYAVRVRDGVLEVVGSDARGAMFGVYDFIERCLGVDPMYFWSGVPHPKRAELAWKDVEIVQDEPSFRFRGWFLNDEDLLTKWREASGVRDYSQYKYYHFVVNHGAMEAVAEALVRSRYNLIIPASFLNATRPAEEGLAAICAARGVFVSMHHIEPMGVSGYTFKDYWKQRGRDLEYSYFKYPREVEEVWRALATRWAKFPNVVWQIGLRGTGDRPMWADDPTMPKDDAGRARLITAALERQLAILDEVGVPRENRHVTTTLWGEGAYFHAKGLLKIPDGVTVVYADNNCGWRWQCDLLDAPPPADGERRGVYYHHQLIGMGPHLVSLVPAARTCAMLREARAKGARDYAIFNVGNVREFVYGIDATAKMTWNVDAFAPESWTRAWVARRLGSNAAAWTDAVNLHYKSLQLQPATGVPCFLDGLMQQQLRKDLHDFKRLLNGKEPCRPRPEPFANAFTRAAPPDPFYAALADTQPVFASPRDTYMRLAAQRAGFEQTLRLARRALAGTAPAERPFAEDFVVYPARLMLDFTTARMQVIDADEALRMGDRKGAAAHLRRAADALRDAVEAGKAYCHGPWTDWYRGCEKVSPAQMLALVEETLGVCGKP
ncbi:MAG: glycosyl hydrolase 115 family protein [Kiritimatiellae bacterium]|nr:glycosyl hydrolase 115 family protein [Kiritimatiellia bacterium]